MCLAQGLVPEHILHRNPGPQMRVYSPSGSPLTLVCMVCICVCVCVCVCAGVVQCDQPCGRVHVSACAEGTLWLCAGPGSSGDLDQWGHLPGEGGGGGGGGGRRRSKCCAVHVGI